jgi:hypothetical protein
MDSLIDYLGDLLGGFSGNILDQDVLGNARQNANEMRETFDSLFQQAVNSPMFDMIVAWSGILCLVMLSVYLVQWFRQASEGQLAASIQGMLLSAMLVALFYGNHASLWKQVLLTEHDLFNRFNQAILETPIAGTKVTDAFATARYQEIQQLVYNAEYQQCLATAEGSRENCFEKITKQQGGAVSRSGNRDVEQLTDELTWVGSGLLILLNVILGWIHAGFQMAIETAFLIAAMVSPLALALSVTPTQTRPILHWQSQVMSLGMMKISLSIITGLVSLLYLQSPALFSGLLLPILLGIFSPVIASYIGFSASSWMIVSFASTISLGTYRKTSRSVAGSINLLTRAARKVIKRP